MRLGTCKGAGVTGWLQRQANNPTANLILMGKAPGCFELIVCLGGGVVSIFLWTAAPVYEKSQSFIPP